jgi:hypothetical protein
MTVGFSSDVSPGIMAGAELRPVEAFSVALEGRWLLPARAVARMPIDRLQKIVGTQEFQTSNISALLVPCLHYQFLMGCGVLQLGFTTNESPLLKTSAGTFGVGPRLGLEFLFAERFLAHVYGDAVFNPAQSYVTFKKENIQYTEPVVIGFLGASLGVTFK